MAIYCYDGSFEGFLTCVHAHYYRAPASDIRREGFQQLDLLEPVVSLDTDPEKAEAVTAAIRRKISVWDLQRVYRGFAAAERGKEMDLLRYLLLGFRIGSGVRSFHSHPAVQRAELLERRVSRETERFLGLVRFSSLEQNILYSAIEPDHDILEFLGEHFAGRLPEELFIIHDLNREKAVIACRGEWRLQMTEPGRLRQLGRAGAQEKEIRSLWCLYFQTVAIRERTNPRCQRALMPERYWKNLVEMTEDNEG